MGVFFFSFNLKFFLILQFEESLQYLVQFISCASAQMKQVIKLNYYFDQQAPDLQQSPVSQEIKAFASTLLDVVKCPLCRLPYMLSKTERLPRIFVHCGHTFCGECLSKFFILGPRYQKNRVRCPMCLKLIKKLHNVQQLPINHTIYAILAKNLSQPADPYKYLCTTFTIDSGDRLRKDNPPQTDEESGMKYCCFHPQRVQHFFCIYHQTPGCRQCMQTRHKRKQCKILDLFDTEALKADTK